MPATDPDPALLPRLRAQDPAAFESLVRTSTPHMLAVALRFLRNDSDAQDAVQEAFLQAYKALPTFQAQSSLSTWLHSITVRACLMRLRKQRSRNETSIDSLLPQFRSDGHRKDPTGRWPAIDASTSEEKRLIRDCIDKLPDDFRNIILLRDIQELSTRETAEHLDISENLVKIRLHRARQALRTLLEPHFRKRP